MSAFEKGLSRSEAVYSTIEYLKALVTYNEQSIDKE